VKFVIIPARFVTGMVQIIVSNVTLKIIEHLPILNVYVIKIILTMVSTHSVAYVIPNAIVAPTLQSVNLVSFLITIYRLKTNVILFVHNSTITQLTTVNNALRTVNYALILQVVHNVRLIII
jgi:hypothetical protein